MAKYNKFLKFVCVGLSNTAVSLTIYYLLKSMGVNYSISIAIGYIVSSITGYFLNKLWVFKADKKEKPVFRYYCLYIISLILNILLTRFQVETLELSDNWAPIFTIAIMTIFNYFVSKKWVFNKDFKIDIKDIKKRMSNNQMLTISFLIMIFVLLFMFINNFYNHPVADDFSNYSKLLYYAPNHSLDGVKSLLLGIIRGGTDTYKIWQGTYFSNYLFFINPLVVSQNMYVFTMFLIQLFWVFSVFYCITSFSNKKTKENYLLISVLFIIFTVMSLYSLGEGFYWFTGAILYIIPFSLSLIFFGLLARYIRSKNKITYAVLIIMAILLGGTSYVTGLFVGFVLLLLTVYMFITHNDLKYKFLILLIVFSLGFLANVLCPGNTNRVSENDKVKIGDIMLISLANMFEMIEDLLFRTIYIPIVILILPIIKKMASQSKIKFVNPILLSILCLICFYCLFMPCSLAYKNYYQEVRVKNIQLLYLSIMAVVCLVNYYGHLYKFNKKDMNDSPRVYTIIGIVSLIGVISAVGPERIAGLELIDDIVYQRSYNYDVCVDEIEKVLNNDEKSVVVTNCSVYPTSLHLFIVYDEGWISDALENYYGKEIEVKK